jgi:3-phosphoshikimate 1-carboxyvinyltransferase
VSHSASPIPVKARPGKALSGSMRPPGDKSISHRALILGLLAIGETTVRGLLEGDDVLRTAEACRALGAQITRDEEGVWHVAGVGIGGLREPEDVLDFGNAGTGSRLMMGVAGSHPVTATFDGDASLRKRPMGRILDPLTRMGVTVVDQAEGGRVPLTLKGPRETIPIRYETPGGPLRADQIRRAARRAERAGHRHRRGEARPAAIIPSACCVCSARRSVSSITARPGG